MYDKYMSQNPARWPIPVFLVARESEAEAYQVPWPTWATSETLSQNKK